jgi:RND family efflux transporter MFP subunit
VSSVKAVFGVPDVVLRQVQLGSTLELTTEAYTGETFAGRVTMIAPSADPRSRVFEIEVTIPNSDGRLKPGSIASLSLKAAAETAPALPQIPLSAIVRAPAHPTKFAVFVVDAASPSATARAREVELGEYLGKVIQVKRGLAGGERVVVQGAGLLSDGEPVEVIR